MAEYIKLKDMMDGWLYEIHARNSNYGIWLEEEGTFAILRRKFNDVYIHHELHYDSHGTAKPIKPIEKTRFTSFLDNDMMSYLKEKINGGLAN